MYELVDISPKLTTKLFKIIDEVHSKEICKAI